MAAVLLGALFFVSASAGHAAQATTCWGSWVTWDGDARTSIGSISFPAGSVFRDDVDVALRRWNSMRGMWFEFDPIVTSPAGFRLGNGRNEIVFATDARVGGALAVTRLEQDLCFFGQEIEEADIEFNVSVHWEAGPHDPRAVETDPSFRFTAVHEMGHFLGLLHEDTRMAAMMSTASAFWASGTETRHHPFPDDCVGARTLYPHENRETDIAISNFRFVANNDTDLILPTGIQSVRRGDSFTTGFAFGNLGNEGVSSFDAIIVLSTNDTISTSDRTIMYLTGWCTPGYFGHHTFTARVPEDMAAGDYYVGGILDPANTLAEHREGNNRVAFAGMIRVLPQ